MKMGHRHHCFATGQIKHDKTIADFHYGVGGPMSSVRAVNDLGCLSYA